MFHQLKYLSKYSVIFAVFSLPISSAFGFSLRAETLSTTKQALSCEKQNLNISLPLKLSLEAYGANGQIVSGSSPIHLNFSPNDKQIKVFITPFLDNFFPNYVALIRQLQQVVYTLSSVRGNTTQIDHYKTITNNNAIELKAKMNQIKSVRFRVDNFNEISNLRHNCYGDSYGTGVFVSGPVSGFVTSFNDSAVFDLTNA
ncbi:MAG: hypothetical protein K2X39_00360, partial [Silvanigrellaceae bacterium]|nr:hypothetical protein [Silvanigrellaceae bacterium]